MSDIAQSHDTARLPAALPFWVSVILPIFVIVAALNGGWTLWLLPMATLFGFSVLDALIDEKGDRAELAAEESALFWHSAVTVAWVPLALVTTFGALAWATRGGALESHEATGLMMGVGLLNGMIGIVYAHELMHQNSRLERWLGDILLGLVIYGHFRSEHLLVHHRHVGTPRDAATARYNEGFYRFFLRVLPSCFRSAWRAEAALLGKRGLPAWHRRNPFWRYGALALGGLAVAWIIGGGFGVGLFLTQAAVAIWLLELVNYQEHYGLTRKHLGDGRYEPARPRHSWNATPVATNWLFINVQRHSDHHASPQRRFPLLQDYPEEQAPRLPAGYPVMGFVAMIPPVWRRLMNPKVRAWRRRHYPEIADWAPYKFATNPVRD